MELFPRELSDPFGEELGTKAFELTPGAGVSGAAFEVVVGIGVIGTPEDGVLEEDAAPARP